MREGRLWRQPSFDLGAKIWQISWVYVLLLCALAGVGYVALYSAGGAPEPYASRHVLRFAAGLVLMIGIALVDIRFIARLAWPTYLVSLVLLVLVARYGHLGKGAQRWIEVGGLQVQPSELMKIALVLALASWFHSASWERIGNPLFLIPPVIAVLFPVALIVQEPNLGTAVITAALGATMFFAAGVRWWKFALIALPVPFAASLVYSHLHGYQRARIDTFLQPESDPLGAGYNIIQSKIALGSGGMWGKGFLQGTQAHLDFLPEKQTDFIFTIIGEEFGFAGGLAVIGAAGPDRVGRHGDRAALPAPVRPPGRIRHRDEFLPLCVRQHRNGDGDDPGRGCAAAAGLARRVGDDHCDDRLRPADVGARAPRCRARRGAPRRLGRSHLAFCAHIATRPIGRTR